jgi:predicted transcriptional regulator
MLPTMLEHDRRQAGWSVGQAAWRLGVSIREYREIEAGERSPHLETWDRICELFGWPQTWPARRVPGLRIRASSVRVARMMLRVGFGEDAVRAMLHEMEFRELPPLILASARLGKPRGMEVSV